MSDRLFMCWWGYEAFGEDIVQTWHFHEFSDDLGYSNSDREQIKELGIGDSWRSLDYWPYHIVTRVR